MGMYAKLFSAANYGIDGYIVTVEAFIANGLPRFKIVGLPDKGVEEAKERVTAAIKASGYTFPLKRITISLGPAELPKHGSSFDLPIALSILIATKQINLKFDLDNSVFAGELGLNSTLRETSGIPIIIETAQEHTKKAVLLPLHRNNQIGKVHIKILEFTNLKSCVGFLESLRYLQPPKETQRCSEHSINCLSINDIAGNELAKRALQIAVAGKHHLAFTGPPGCGKTTLAQSAKDLFPPPTSEEIAEILKIYSISNEETPSDRPFRSPHQSASFTSILGGGSIPVPGEITLAHNGILFLDELPEFSKQVINGLRIPLESGRITVSRKHRRTTFPANFLLITAMNPCPCGNSGNSLKPCQCRPHEINNYKSRVSNAIWDRIDLNVPIFQVDATELEVSSKSDNLPKIKRQIELAQELQRKRGRFNSKISLPEVPQFCPMSQMAQNLLKQAYQKLGLSIRGYLQIIRAARTIADLENKNVITEEQIAEALVLRKRD